MKGSRLQNSALEAVILGTVFGPIAGDLSTMKGQGRRKMKSKICGMLTIVALIGAATLVEGAHAATYSANITVSPMPLQPG